MAESEWVPSGEQKWTHGAGGSEAGGGSELYRLGVVGLENGVSPHASLLTLPSV